MNNKYQPNASAISVFTILSMAAAASYKRNEQTCPGIVHYFKCNSHKVFKLSYCNLILKSNLSLFQ